MDNTPLKAPPKGFDPFTQTLTLLLPDGEEVPLTVEDINAFAQYGIRICINYSSQIGASFVLLVILLLITSPDKRRSAVFSLNCITLALNLIQRLLQCLYFTGAFYNPYIYFSGDYSQIPSSQISISVAGVVLQTIQIICLEASLVLQVRAVCATMSRLWQAAILVVSSLVAAVVIGFRFAVMVLNCKAIVAIVPFSEYQWLAAASLYTLTASICFFSAIFVAKLAVALKQRKKLGLRSFGPMQIIFIMGCQTLIIPAIFSILQWVNLIPELGSQVLTLVSLFLPLSAIWASQSLQSGTQSSVVIIPKSARRRLMGFSFTRPGWIRNKSNLASTGVQSTGKTTASHPTIDEPETPKYDLARKAGDLEAGGSMHILKRQDVEVSEEKQ